MSSSESARFSKIFPRLKVIANPSERELRRWAHSEEQSTIFQAPAYFSRHKADILPQNIFVVGEEGLNSFKPMPIEKATELMNMLQPAMEQFEWVMLNMRLGAADHAAIHARLVIPKSLSRIGVLWGRSLLAATDSEKDPQNSPEVLVACFPHWREFLTEPLKATFPDQIILLCPEAGIAYLLGVDRAKEVRRAFFALGRFAAQKRGGVLLPAATKSLRGVSFLICGGPGSGKSVLAFDDHQLSRGEVQLFQNGGVFLTSAGEACGMEKSFCFSTDWCDSSEWPDIFKALLDSDSVFENISVHRKTMEIDFSIDSNRIGGFALMERQNLPFAALAVDLNRVDKLVILKRFETEAAPIAKLSGAQAVRVLKNEGLLTEGESANFQSILGKNNRLQFYLLNTGHGISKKAPARLLALLSEPNQPCRWIPDAESGFELPEDKELLGTLSK
ncbi:MAG: hypothetical protein A3G41_05755 [Elusimicrobia bacterium RIFCSPLOWO2_12_FULL_59_9]|nr:MAG: hypothetical protein A3G41_05755 [Elusimicrobia bacterium RIFCSPLOWO2_12_FULL_59_9]